MNNLRLVFGLGATLVAIVLFSSVALAQNRERFVISAKAGGVNAVSGHVVVKRAGQTEQLLTSQDNLESGDTVSAGIGSRAEILLNPGTYLRISENSQFILVDNSLDKLEIKLITGNAIIEATGTNRVQLQIPIVTEQQRMTIVRAGVYRIEVAPGLTELLVWKGRVFLGNDRLNIVKAGTKITFTGGTNVPLTAKLTKRDKDAFDAWSKERGETLTRANQRLSARTLNGYLSSASFGWPFGFGRWGVWTWSSRIGCYTFLPFFYGWGSPYGGFYDLYAGFGGFYSDGTCCRTQIYTQPTVVYTPGPTNPNGIVAPNHSGGVTSVGKGSMDVAPRPADPTPAPQPAPRPEPGGRGSKIRDPLF